VTFSGDPDTEASTEAKLSICWQENVFRFRSVKYEERCERWRGN